MQRLSCFTTLIVLSTMVTTSLFAADPAPTKPKRSESAQLIYDAVAAKSDKILDVSHSVWDYAELGFKEFKSAKKITEVLKSEGFAVEEQAGGIPTAFIARYGKGKPVVGFMAEYDALPKLGQEKGVPVRKPRKDNENGHGCGHSSLGAGSVGAAIAVKEYLKAKQCSGTIVLFGTPAEETGYGKAFMVKAGCFKGIDAVFAWHPSTVNSAVQGDNNAYYRVVFTFHGVSAHAAGSPERGRSAVDACELMCIGTNFLREHMSSNARVHYAWTNPGGSAPNIVYDEAQLTFFVRSPSIVLCRTLVDRVVKIAKGAALMTETTMEYKILGGLNNLVINSVMGQTVSDALVEMGPPEFDDQDDALARKFIDRPGNAKGKWAALAKSRNQTEEEFLRHPLNRNINRYKKNAIPPRGFASTDDGDVSWVVPLGRMNMATSVAGTSSHSWEWTAQIASSIGDKGTLAAARTLARAATLLFEKPQIIEQAKKELQNKTQGNYISPIPDGITPADL